MSSQNLPPTEKRTVVVTSPAGDILFYERFNASKQRRGKAAPAMGTAHLQSSRFPNHKVCGITPDGEEGWLRIYYMADRASQEDYNWEHSELLGDEYPRVTQTWVVRRSVYQGAPPTPVAPPVHTSLALAHPRVWRHIGRQEVRMDATTDGLFVQYEDVWLDISQGLTGVEFDSSTGALTDVVRQLVEAGTPGSGIGPDGTYTTIRPINRDWSESVTRAAQGLAGKAVKGVAYRTLQGRGHHPWPAVLAYVFIRASLVDPNDFASAVNRYVTSPVWRATPTNGPCEITTFERWTSKEPVIGGNPAWNTDSPSDQSPHIPISVGLQRGEVDFRGDLLTVQLPPCLHPGVYLYEPGVAQYFEPTSPPQWPSELLVQVTVDPDQGGWMTRWVVVKAPSQAGQSTGVDLTFVSATPTTATVQWNPEPGEVVTPAETLLYVSELPDFSSAFLPGYNGLDITPPDNDPETLQHTITGLTRGQVYYVRIKRVEFSNILTILGKPVPELQVTWDEDPAALAFGTSLLVGAAVTRTITVSNPGLISLQVGYAFGGAAGADYSLTGLPSVILPGGTHTVTVSLTPTATGTRAGELTITTDAPTDGVVVIDLTGTGVAPETNVVFDGSNVASGGTVNLSSVAQGGALLVGTTRTAVVTVQNTGTSPLTVSAVLVTSDELSITKSPGSTIAAGGSTTLEITSAPESGGTKTGVLTLTNDDADEGTYVLNLSLTTTTAPVLQVTNPYAGVATSGQTIDWGRLLVSGGVAALTYTLKNVGSAQLTSLASAITGTNAAQWLVAPSLPTTLDVGASVNMVAYYTPTGANGTVHTAVISVTSNDAASPFVSNVTGTSQTSTTSTQEIQVEYPRGIAIATGQAIALGTVTIATGSEITVRIRNLGLVTLSSILLTAGGTHSADVAIGAYSTSLAAGGQQDFTITFTPGGLGARVATVTIASNDASEASIVLNLSATGAVANPLTTHQSASIVIGQANPTDQVSATTRAILTGPGAVAVSASGYVAVADTAAHRVLIYPPNMDEDGQDALVVFGQTDFTSSLAGCSATRLNAPKGVAWSGESLIVADTGNNRVLILSTRPTVNGASANVALGQTSMTANAAGCTAAKMRLPSGVYVDADSVLWVADTGNHRVLKWLTVPTEINEPADVVVGQASMTTRTSGNSDSKLKSPTGIARTGTKLIIVDGGNHRAVIFNTVPVSNGPSANNAIGQSAFGVGSSGLTSSRFNTPSSAVVLANGGLAVADTGNNRVLLFEVFPTSNGAAGTAVLGQSDFTTGTAFTGGTTAASMSGPQSVAVDGTRLFVSGTNMKRVMQFAPAV